MYVRTGSSNRKADSALIAEMKRYAQGVSFDEQPMPNLESGDIDFGTIFESFAPIRKLNKNDLNTLRLLVQYQGRSVPTIGGMLLFGRDRLMHFPDAWIKAGRFVGTDKARIQDHVDLTGHPISAIEDAETFVKKHMERSADISALKRKDKWTLPLEALRESLINAVVHADYSQRGTPIRIAVFDDRIEVENPGLLPFGLEVEDLKRGVSSLRNRIIGRVFNELGLIEQWGSGIQRMTRACEDAGLMPPDFEEIGTQFRVTLHTVASGKPKTDPLDLAILDLLSRHDGRSTAEIAEHIDQSRRATRARLVRLVDRGGGKGNWIRSEGSPAQILPHRTVRAGGIVCSEPALNPVASELLPS
ncbi:MAG: winged helix-turn-helix transcriptional regulator [Rhodobacteraceae bacterium]|nr:winged helix-turn-helix transcriptional regulator [Paracoccaceae bacterium]